MGILRETNDLFYSSFVVLVVLNGWNFIFSSERWIYIKRFHFMAGRKL